MSNFSVDGKEIIVRIIKYVLEGSMVAIAAYMIPMKKPSAEEVLTIALVAAATFALLDMFAPSVGASARLGAGFGIGSSLVNWPAGSATHVRGM
jgi:ABC-type Co2+ transport system permease subunit